MKYSLKKKMLSDLSRFQWHKKRTTFVKHPVTGFVIMGRRRRRELVNIHNTTLIIK